MAKQSLEILPVAIEKLMFLVFTDQMHFVEFIYRFQF
jgi:hypothetical protein